MRTVYVIDDDRAVLDSMAFLLESIGFQCELFSDPADFLRRVGDLHAGCVITDYRMPGMTGLELIAALRDRSINWPIFLMSSDHGAELEKRATSFGFTAFLRKPILIDTLTEALYDGFAKIDPTDLDPT